MSDRLLAAVLNNKSRLEALRKSNLLDSPREQLFDHVTASVCETLQVPISLVTIISPDRQFFKSSVGLAPAVAAARETPIQDSACQYVVKQGSLVVIGDVRNDPFFKLHQGMRNIDAGAYLGTPLLLYGQVIGSVCAVDTKPRPWSESEIEFIESKANMLAVEVSRRASMLG